MLVTRPPCWILNSSTTSSRVGSQTRAKGFGRVEERTQRDFTSQPTRVQHSSSDTERESRVSVAINSFRCICFLGSTSHGPFCLSPYHQSVGSLVVLDLVRTVWWNMGIQLGRSQPRARFVDKKSSVLTSLSQTSYLPKVREKGNTGSRNSSPGMSRPQSKRFSAMSRKSSRGLLECIHHASNRKQTVKMQSWTTVQKPIGPRSTRRQRRTTNCGKFSRTCQKNTGRSSTMTVSSQKCNRWMMRKLPCWQPKGNSYPCKVGSINRKTIWSVSRKKSNRNRRNVWNPAKIDRGRSGIGSSQKSVNQGNPGFQSRTSGSISDQAAQHTVLSVFKSVLSMQSMGCHDVSEQLMPAGATEDDVKKISQVMAQTVRTLEAGNAAP